MYVICAGMYRACSTWQYEVIAHLIESHWNGIRLGYLTGRRFAAFDDVWVLGGNLGHAKRDPAEHETRKQSESDDHHGWRPRARGVPSGWRERVHRSTRHTARFSPSQCGCRAAE